MFITKFKPADRSFDTLMKDFLHDDYGFFTKPFSAFKSPAVNVVETNDNFRLDFAVPGFSKDDFNIKLDGTLLTVSSEKKSEVKKEDEKFTTKEFNFSSFARTFTLPETVDSTNIKAEYTDGILKVLVPKKEEVKQKPVEIKIS